MSDKNLKEQVLESLKNIKVALGLIKDEPAQSKITTKDGKELTFSGELKEGVELKFNDTALENGTYETIDKKFIVEDGKLLKFEATDPGDEQPDKYAELSAAFELLKAENKTLKAEFKSVLDVTNKTVEAVESIALALESSEKPAGGGNEGEGMISKADWVIKKATKSE